MNSPVVVTGPQAGISKALLIVAHILAFLHLAMLCEFFLPHWKRELCLGEVSIEAPC